MIPPRGKLVHLLAGALLLLAASCSREYEWTRFGIPASKVEWYHVTLTEMYAMCDPKHESFPNGGLGGCAFYIGKGGTCYVYSMYSEWEAHRVMSGDGLTLYEHEVGDREKPDRPFGHCNGWVHTNPLPKR